MKERNQNSPHGTGVVILEIPLEQCLIVDPEPLSEEEEVFVAELARQIEEDGLKILPEVCYVCTEEGKHFYRLIEGKKRWHAFTLLRRDFLICRVIPSSEVTQEGLLS